MYIMQQNRRISFMASRESDFLHALNVIIAFVYQV